MNLIVLTTETTHHCHFTREIARFHPIQMIVNETRGHRAPYSVHHPFEDERDRYEREAWFTGDEPQLGTFAETIEVNNANDSQAIELLKKAKPDVIIVFGAGRLHQTVINLCPDSIINLHGGDPEHYRGLDTHLWVIWHQEFDQLISTLHHVNIKLDDGAIIGRQLIPIQPGMKLYELRRANTELCIILALTALQHYDQHGAFSFQSQPRCGRYYSAMPAILKDVCVQRFHQYTNSLP